jgi:hypothetical protein
MKQFIRTEHTLKPHFWLILIRPNLWENQFHHWKERNILVQKQHYHCPFALYLYMTLYFEWHGNFIRAGMHNAYMRIQATRNLHSDLSFKAAQCDETNCANWCRGQGFPPGGCGAGGQCNCGYRQFG